jgi:hypothetical protein
MSAHPLPLPPDDPRQMKALEALAVGLAGKPRCYCPDDWRQARFDACPQHGTGEWPTEGHRLLAQDLIASLAEQGVVLVEQPQGEHRKESDVINVRVPLTDLQHGVIPAGVLSLPGLRSIVMDPPASGSEAELTFVTSPGCTSPGVDYVRAEVERMGARVLVIREEAVEGRFGRTDA